MVAVLVEREERKASILQRRRKRALERKVKSCFILKKQKATEGEREREG